MSIANVVNLRTIKMERSTSKYLPKPNFDYIKKIRRDIAQKRNLSMSIRFPYINAIEPRKPIRTKIRKPARVTHPTFDERVLHA